MDCLNGVPTIAVLLQYFEHPRNLKVLAKGNWRSAQPSTLISQGLRHPVPPAAHIVFEARAFNNTVKPLGPEGTYCTSEERISCQSLLSGLQLPAQAGRNQSGYGSTI